MRKLQIHAQLMLFALVALSSNAFAQTPQLFTPSGAASGTTSSAGVGIGTSNPNAALGIKPSSTLSFPALAIEATDAANTYSLYVEGLSGGDKHVQISTADANSRLSLKCASATDKAPRLQMTSPNDVRANTAGAIFDYGSREVYLPDAKFKMRWMPGKANDPAVDMITSDGTAGVYLAPTVGNVGIGTDSPSEALEVAGNIKAANIEATGDLNVGGTINMNTLSLNNASVTNQLYVRPNFLINTTSNGPVIFGDTLGYYLTFDNNEIQARGFSADRTLYLNYWGGDVSMAGGNVYVEEDVSVSVSTLLDANAGLEVSGGDLLLESSDPFLKINQAGGSGDYGIVFQENGVTDAWIYKSNNDWLQFSASSSSSPDMIILPNGNVSMSEALIIAGGHLSLQGIGGNLPEINLGNAIIRYDGNNEVGIFSDFKPVTHNLFDLGTSSERWDDVYATNGVIQTSDRRTKSNIEDLHYGLEEIMQLRPVSFEWKGKEGMAERKLGLIAQEVQPILDEVVKEKDLKINEEGEIVEVELERLGLYYSDIIPVLINGMQEQQAMLDEQSGIIKEQNDINQAQQDLIESQNDEIEMLKNTLKDFGMIGDVKVNDLGNASPTNEQTRLFQNRPNPFDNTTVIPYFLAENVSGQIILSDVRSGSPVATYDIHGQGHAEVRVEAGSLSAGAYTYTLLVNGQKVASKVMVLTR